MGVPWVVVVCRGALICLPPLGALLFAVAGAAVLLKRRQQA